MIYMICYMLMPCVEDEARARASWRATRSETVEGHRDYRFRLFLFQIFTFEFEYLSLLTIFYVDRARVGLQNVFTHFFFA
ncbi:hypothetical protein IC575_012031 [Cucumis melo]